MKLGDYLLDRFFGIVCLVVTGLLCFALLRLVGTPEIFILFLEVILAAGWIAFLLWDYWRRRGYYRQLFRLLDEVEEKTLLGELTEPPRFLDGRILEELIRCSDKYRNDQIEAARRESREYREYLELWVHEIKTPITSARLTAENHKNEVTLRMDDELRKIDSLVEQVLYYARSFAAQKDFRVEKTTLHELVNRALKAYSKPLIQAGCRIRMEGLEQEVCADVKSSAFVIGQLLTNAAKYSRDPFHLTFRGWEEEQAVCLSVEDDGIGIPAADLSRVFDKGFTGENGRRFPKATGMGLYLCRRLCRNMNVKLEIASRQGEGTKVTLRFPREKMVQIGFSFPHYISVR